MLTYLSFSQLLPGDRLLIVVRDETSSQFKFYLDRLVHMSTAVQRDPMKKVRVCIQVVICLVVVVNNLISDLDGEDRTGHHNRVR